ncbi:hypothetical protein CASFOL_008141 [Castilleja foliolosa]|uniref:BHLH domain-containing protein n=1 Tax=Castilleja foliolosa TaxID=1961234 RepID=A0ABD3DY43_9LAMI
MDQFLFQLQSPPLRAGAVEYSSAVDEAYINGVYDGLNFRSFLNQVTEPLFSTNDVVLPSIAPPFSFFPESANMFSSHHVEKLPSLHSLETAASPEPEFRINRQFKNMHRRDLRQRVTERVRDLQKLLPVDKKMDTATVLEETHKYISFLVAQISVLQSMPEYNSEDWGIATAESGGDLGRLNRQQVLEVFVNSPAAQKWLIDNECCVCSAEQLALLKKNAWSCHDLLPYVQF